MQLQDHLMMFQNTLIARVINIILLNLNYESLAKKSKKEGNNYHMLVI